MEESDQPGDAGFDRLAQRLTSGPPCRTCGNATEPGWLVVRHGELARFGTGTVAIAWHDVSTKPVAPGHAVPPGPEVETLAWGKGGSFHALEGFRCPECRHIEVAYGSNPAPLAPSPDRPA